LLANRAKISILEDSAGMAQFHNQKEELVSDVETLLNYIRLGLAARSIGSTEANMQSSRGHAIIQISKTNVVTNILGAKFTIIDLAGSERGVDTGSMSRKARREGSNINKSLLMLKECIRAIYIKRGGGSVAHIPFRASKLTLLLRDSLTGKGARCAMIAMVSPGSSSCEHTLNTLRYADRLKELRTSPTFAKDEENELLSPSDGQLTQENDEIVFQNEMDESSDNDLSDEILKNTQLDEISDSNVTTDLEVEEIAAFHLQCLNKTNQLHQKEKLIISNRISEKESESTYLERSIEILEQKINLWTELIQKMNNAKIKTKAD
jgi:kinesin family protein 2/24